MHDGARPLVTCDDIERLVAALTADPQLDGAVLAVPSTDTVKIVDEDGIIIGTPSRRGLWRAQTPADLPLAGPVGRLCGTGRGRLLARPTTRRSSKRAEAAWRGGGLSRELQGHRSRRSAHRRTDPGGAATGERWMTASVSRGTWTASRSGHTMPTASSPTARWCWGGARARA